LRRAIAASADAKAAPFSVACRFPAVCRRTAADRPGADVKLIRTRRLQQMMQTTRTRRLDRLVRRGGTEEPLSLIFEWVDSGQAARRHSRDTKESGVTAVGDPVLNSAWAAPEGDGKGSL
jgi:hypothetical protein